MIACSLAPIFVCPSASGYSSLLPPLTTKLSLIYTKICKTLLLDPNLNYLSCHLKIDARILSPINTHYFCK